MIRESAIVWCLYISFPLLVWQCTLSYSSRAVRAQHQEEENEIPRQIPTDLEAPCRPLAPPCMFKYYSIRINIHFLLMPFWDNGSFICVLSSSYVKTKDTLAEDLKEETLMNWEFKIQMELPLSVLTCFINIWRLIYSRLAGGRGLFVQSLYLTHTIRKNKHSKMAPFYELIDGAFGSKTVASLCHTLPWPRTGAPHLRTAGKRSMGDAGQRPGFSRNTTRAPVQGHLG